MKCRLWLYFCGMHFCRLWMNCRPWLNDEKLPQNYFCSKWRIVKLAPGDAAEQKFALLQLSADVHVGEEQALPVAILLLRDVVLDRRSWMVTFWGDLTTFWWLNWPLKTTIKSQFVLSKRKENYRMQNKCKKSLAILLCTACRNWSDEKESYDRFLYGPCRKLAKQLPWTASSSVKEDPGSIPTG
jgi:hypothetical protein